MGKKKNKKKSNIMKGGEGIYDQARNNRIAQHLEEYIDTIQRLFILEGKKYEDVEKAIKTIEKAIANLREGKPEKVWDVERFEEYEEEESENRIEYYGNGFYD